MQHIYIYHSYVCTLGCPTELLSPERVMLKFLTEGKRKLDWSRVRKYIRFLISFISNQTTVKNLFCGFSEISLFKTSYEFTSFSIFDPTKKSTKKKYFKFQQHFFFGALHKRKNSLHAHNVFLGSGFWASLERRVDEIKTSKSEIILKILHL